MNSVKPVNEMYNTKCPCATVSMSQSEQNEKEALMERRPAGHGRKTVYMYQERIVSFCNSTDRFRTNADDNDLQRNGVLIWISSFITMIVMKMASCIGQ